MVVANKKKKIAKPKACKKCQRRQCDLTCPSLDEYTRWRRHQN